MRRARRLDGRPEARFHAQVGHPRGHVVAQGRAEQLPLLSEHPVAVQIAVGGEVGHDLELVLGVLERPGDALAAVCPTLEHRLQHGVGIGVLVL